MKKNIIAIILLAVWNLYPLTFEDIVKQVRLKLQDTGPTSQDYYYNNDDLYRQINIVQNEIVNLTDAIETYTIMSVTAGQREYQKPSDVLRIKRVAFWIKPSTTAFKRLDFITLNGLDVQTSHWQKLADGQPTKYYERGNYIGLVPAPSTSYSTSSALCINYIKLPTQISTSTLTNEAFDGLSYLKPYHSIIVIGTVAYLTLNPALLQQYYYLINIMKEKLAGKEAQFPGLTIFERD